MLSFTNKMHYYYARGLHSWQAAWKRHPDNAPLPGKESDRQVKADLCINCIRTTTNICLVLQRRKMRCEFCNPLWSNKL